MPAANSAKDLDVLFFSAGVYRIGVLWRWRSGFEDKTQRLADSRSSWWRTRAGLFGFIYALVHNVADTEDLFQQTGSSTLWRKF